MNRFNVNGIVIEMPRIHDGLIFVRNNGTFNFKYDVKNIDLGNAFAECESRKIKEHIRKTFQSLKDKIVHSDTASRLAYIELFKQLCKKLSNSTLIKDIDFVTKDDEVEFSKPEIYSLEESEVEKGFDKSSNDEHISSSDAVVLNADGTPYVASRDNNEISYDNIQESEIVSNPLVVESNVEYKTDPSSLNVESNQQERPSLYEKLHAINLEGRIFNDESRIEDPNLNIYNAISLNKFNNEQLGEVSVDQSQQDYCEFKDAKLNLNPTKTSNVNTKINRLLELGNVRCDIFKKVCNACTKKCILAKQKLFEIKQGIENKFKNIPAVNINKNTIAEMSKKLCGKISNGSKNLAIKFVDKSIENNQNLREKLVELKEKISNVQYENIEVDEIARIR